MEPLAAVGLVMALLAGAAWAAARRRNGLPLLRGGLLFRRGLLAGPSARRLSVVERLPLTPSHALHLVQLDGRPYLVATHPQGVSFPTQAPEPATFAGAFAAAAGSAAPAQESLRGNSSAGAAR